MPSGSRSGTLTQQGTLHGKITGMGTLTGRITGGAYSTSPFEGPYEVTPLAGQQTVMATTGKSMTDDVTVLAIPITRTLNAAGGYTVTIG